MPNTTFIHAHAAERVPRGMFWGFSMDFWIVLWTNVLGVPLCMAVVHMWIACVARRVDLGDPGDSDSDEEASRGLLTLTPSRPSSRLTFIQQLLDKPGRSRDATFNLDLAVRGTVVAFFCALTYYVPALSWWQSHGWSMSYVVVMLAFTFYKDVGTTVMLAWSGYYGTLLAVLNCYVLYSMFPDGATTGSHAAWWFGLVNLVGVTWDVVSCNFHTNAKMFFLSWQAYYSMCFLNPNDDALFSKGFHRITLEGADTSALMGTVIGCIFALLCTLIPNCLSALRMAQETVGSIAWEQGMIWQRLLAHATDGPGTLDRELLRSEIRALQDKRDLLSGHITNSWWECFDLGSTGALRGRLVKLSSTLERLQDWLEGAWFALETKSPASGAARQLLMQIAPELSHLQQVSWALLCAVVRAAGSSEEEFSSEQEEEISELLKRQEAAQASLAAVMQAKRAQLLGKRCITEESLPGQALAYSLSAWSETVASIAVEFLEDDGEVETSGQMTAFLKGFVTFLVPRGNTQKRIRRTLKLCCTFFVVFTLGWLGIRANVRWVMPNFNATPPGTVAYLLFSGNEAAALKKNTDRLLGVSSGVFLGQFVFVIICDMATDYWQYRIPIRGLGLLVYCWIELRAFFNYFNSILFSYPALLIVAFFAEHALQNCGELSAYGISEDRSNYQNLVGQFAAILIATFVDFWTDAPQAVEAANSLTHFSSLYKDSLQRLAPAPGGEDNLAAQASEGTGAANEARVFQPPWRRALWDKMHNSCCELWRLVMVITLSAGTNRELMKLPAMRSLLDTLASRAERSLNFSSSILLFDNTGREPDIDGTVKQLLATSSAPEQLLSEALAEVNAALEKQSCAKLAALTGDSCCAMAAVLASVEASCGEIRRLERGVLDEPDLREFALS